MESSVRLVRREKGRWTLQHTTLQRGFVAFGNGDWWTEKRQGSSRSKSQPPRERAHTHTLEYFRTKAHNNQLAVVRFLVLLHSECSGGVFPSLLS